jgi:hypothetical protein
MGCRPTVSVCLRASGRPATLAAAIESVLAQTYEDFELVISDDAGGAESVAAGFADPRVRYHHNPAPAGPAANLTRVMSLSRGRFLANMNDDDLWLPGFLERTVGVLESHPDVGVVFTNDLFDVGGVRFARDLPFRPGRHDAFLRGLLEHSMPACAALIRREVWDTGERTVPLTPAMVGDVLVWLRAAAAGWPFYYLDEPLGVSRVHPGQVSWSEEGLPTRMIATHDAFRLGDPACEALRRARMAEFLLARAHVHLTHRRFSAARADIASAHRESPRPLGLRAALAVTGLRGLLMRWGPSHPRLLVPLLKLWRRMRPGVLPRGSAIDAV